MHEDTTRFSGVEFQLQTTKDAISHSPQGFSLELEPLSKRSNRFNGFAAEASKPRSHFGNR